MELEFESGSAGIDDESPGVAVKEELAFGPRVRSRIAASSRQSCDEVRNAIVNDPLVDVGMPCDDDVGSPGSKRPLQRRLSPVDARGVWGVVEEDDVPG